MRWLILIATIALLAAQTPAANIINASRPVAHDFQTGERFQVVITAAAGQPISVRTSRQGRIDWGPVIGWTDSSGRWSVEGQFDKSDFGGWSEAWTVGGELANPVLKFGVSAPCLKSGHHNVAQSGPNVFEICDTAAGNHQAFGTPSLGGALRTPDGRTIPDDTRSQTVEQYHAKNMQSLITNLPAGTAPGLHGDEAGDLILKIIGVNALTSDETRNVLSMVNAAYASPQSIPKEAKSPTRTLVLLQTLADETADAALKQRIAETVASLKVQ